MSNEAYLMSKYTPIKRYIDGVWCDDKTVLIWCENYRHITHLMHAMYHDLDKRRCQDVKMIKHQTRILIPHINKEFKFFCDLPKAMSYKPRTPIFDARGTWEL